MTAFSVQTLDHVTVSVPRHLEASVLDWYLHTLGLEQIPKPDGTSSSGGWFLAGTCQVHVAIEPEVAERPGHFGLVVDHFQSAVDHLRRAGSRIEDARAIPGRSRCYTCDPAGNTIEILCYHESSRA